MKVLYCITSSSWGGAQLNVLELCNDQINRGNEVVFVVGNSGPLLDRVKKINGVKVILLPSLKREISPFNDIKTIFKLHKLIKRESPDIVHLHSSKAGTLGRLATIGTNAKNVFTVHGWAFTEGSGSPLKRGVYTIVEKLVEPFTDLFICVSQYDEKIGLNHKVLKPSHNNYCVVHNGAPIEDTTQKSRVRNAEKIKFIMTARFSPQKDQATLLKAISKVNKSNYELILVGDGPTKQENEKLSEDLGISDNVKFTGFKSDVNEALKAADVYILSTKYEGLPISIIEAMSQHLPIIATNVGGNSELVKDNGFLVNNETELTDKINWFVNHQESIETMGNNSYQLFVDEFSLEKCMQETNNRYLELIN